MLPFSCPDKGMHLHCVSEMKRFVLLKILRKNVVRSSCLFFWIVAVVFCKIKRFLVALVAIMRKAR